MKINEEQYQKLKKYERHLLTASRANYVTAMYRSTADELTCIYNAVFNTQKRTTTCMKCMLNICKQLAPLYFEYKENEEAEQQVVEDEQVEKTEEENNLNLDTEKIEDDKVEVVEKEKTVSKPKPQKKKKKTAKK